MLKGNLISCANCYLQNQSASYAWFLQQSSKAVIYPTCWNLALKHIKLPVKYCCFLDEVPAFRSLPSDINWTVLSHHFFLLLECVSYIEIPVSRWYWFLRRLAAPREYMGFTIFYSSFHFEGNEFSFQKNSCWTCLQGKIGFRRELEEWPGSFLPLIIAE